MTCDECGQKPASLHFTKIINGEKTEMHLCETCAQDKGEVFNGGNEHFSIHHLFSDFLNLEKPPSSPLDSATTKQQIRCENCGLTYRQFSKSGRFGCSDCYSYFNHRLNSLFRRIHGNTEHSGKVPERSGGEIKVRKELDHLKRELQMKIHMEEFEEAAEVRDRIRDLENQMDEEGGK